MGGKGGRLMGNKKFGIGMKNWKFEILGVWGGGGFDGQKGKGCVSTFLFPTLI